MSKLKKANEEIPNLRRQINNLKMKEPVIKTIIKKVFVNDSISNEVDKMFDLKDKLKHG
jgi:CRISPR/Cas system CMR subunit Cmr6 (Cas7 group RAMP superfamily)